MEVVALIAAAISTLVSVATLIALLVRGIFSLERRLTKLETQIEPFWNALRNNVTDWLQGLDPAGNPISPERWDYLLTRLRENTLDPAEGLELNNAMLEKREEARRDNDRAALLALGLGLALLAPIISGQPQR